MNAQNSAGDKSFQKAAPMLYNAQPVTINNSSFSGSLYKKVKDIFIYKSIHRMINDI